jgi:two-component system chemotaxis response regulator CheY
MTFDPRTDEERPGDVPPRLLVVDDALIMRKILHEVATSAGWLVVGEAGNGADAVALYREHRPDLVTLDLVMPVLGGFDALRQIRAFDPDARVVIVSAIDQRQALVDAITAGAIDFIVKPFERERIVGVLTKVAAALAASGRGVR